MAKKRKLESKSTEPSNPQPYFQAKEEPEYQPPTEEELEEEGEEEGEEYEEIEEEEDDDEDDPEEENNNDPDDEPIRNLLEPFNKDQLIKILEESAAKHSDIAARIRSVADEDPSHRKIFVHGLGWDTKAETLINFFSQYGEIEDGKAVVDKVSGKSKGYGFILFKSRSAARKALKEPQKKIGNRMTACQLASMGPVPASASAMATVAPAVPVSEYTQRKIYVSNVSAELDPQKLLNFFAKFGEIEEGPLGLDRHTGKPKGFALFVYKSIGSAKKALEEPHKNFEGQILHCQRAIDGPKPGKSQGHHHNLQNSNFGALAGPSHLMAPQANAAFGQASAAAQAMSPAVLGQALTALLTSQGAGLGLTNLLGIGSAVNPAAPSSVNGLQAAYGSQGMGGTTNPYGSQAGYGTYQVGQGGSGARSQHGAGHLGYMGH